jgi:hypothetical protein
MTRYGRDACIWLGWAYLAKRVPHAATTPIVTAFKICISHRKKELLNRLPAKVSFRFLTRFLHTGREVTSPQPAWGGKTCAKVAREHPGSSGGILHRTSTKNHRGIEVNPSALWLAHCLFWFWPDRPNPAKTRPARAWRVIYVLYVPGAGNGECCW